MNSTEGVLLELEIEKEQEQPPGQSTAPEESNDKSSSAGSDGGGKGSLSENISTVARPKKNLRGHYSQPRLVVPVEGSGAPAPQPSKYKVVPDCDPDDDSNCSANLSCGPLCGEKDPLANLLDPVKKPLQRLFQPVVVSTSNPNVNVNPPACEVDNRDGKGSVKRQTWGIPMI
jgi:hypothetical protein